ncbi:MAG TPA: hypothetical protein VI756_21845, partial [Blastocatellia bacterium]
MTKTMLLSLLTISLAASARADTVVASGTFSSTDMSDSFVIPGDPFSLSFQVVALPVLTPSQYTSVSFAVPILGFSYDLNNLPISVTPTGITFYTAADGGGFAVNFPTAEFIFSGSQIFSGPTSAPSFVLGSHPSTGWTFLDSNNIDFGAGSAITVTPEPSSLVLFSFIGLVLVGVRLMRFTSRFTRVRRTSLGCLLAVLAIVPAVRAQVPVTPSINVPNTGQTITPLAPAGSRFTYLNPGLTNYPNDVVEFAVSAATTPDRKTLAVITSGDYGIYTSTGAHDTSASTEWLFIFDISHGIPVQKQAIQVTNTYQGLAFDPSGQALYVSGGRDDIVHIYTVSAGLWSQSATVALGHTAGLGSGVPPEAAGIAITSDGTKIVVANYENDSVSVLSNAGGSWAKVGELDLRPPTVVLNPNGTFGGEYPFWVSIANNTAYVSTIRDRQVVAVDITTPSSPAVIARITT